MIKGAVIETNSSRLSDVLCQKAKIMDVSSIKLFSQAGADMNETNYDGRTVAHVAASEQNEEILKILSKNPSVDFNLKDRWGKTPLDEIEDEFLKQIIRQNSKSASLTVNPCSPHAQ